MNIQRRRAFCLPLVLVPGFASAAARPMLIGSYDQAQMKAMKGLTFPRVLVCGADGKSLSTVRR